ncbi:hypothetical protein [Nocardia heshunensis]
MGNLDRLMQQVRRWSYGPTWLLSLLIGFGCALIHIGFTALTTREFDGWDALIGLIPGAISAVAAAVGIILVRQRYGGRELMRHFFDSVYTHRLPHLRTALDVSVYGQLLDEESARRERTRYPGYWPLAVAALLSATFAVLQRSSVQAVITVAAVGYWLWLLYWNPRILRGLYLLKAQFEHYRYNLPG